MGTMWMRALALGAGVMVGWGMAMEAGQRDGLWKRVEEAMGQGLPQTAITNLEAIVPAALQEQAYGEAAKALLRKVLLEGTIQGNKPEEKIARLEAGMGQVPGELRPLLQSVQAHWYWHYFQRHRWQFMQRTRTTVAPGEDFTTWDIPRLFGEIDRHFRLSLAEPERLQGVAVGSWGDLLEKGTMPDRYRPTLYDFLAHEALGFYMTGEQGLAKPEDALDLAADEPVYGVVRLFGSVDEFLRGKLERRAGESNAEKALFLLRDLLRFHQRDEEGTALAHVDLVRLRWAWNVATGEEKAGLYKKALEAFVGRWADHELAAEALHEWARVLHEEGDWAGAHRLAVRGAEAHGSSVGGRQCRNLAREIEARSLEVTVERVWQGGKGELTVRYRNVTNVHFRVVAFDWHTFLEKNHGRPENLNERDRAEVLAKAPVQQWSVALPQTADYRVRAQAVGVPAGLKPGFYFLLASVDPGFGAADNVVACADFWVSELALVVRQNVGVTQGFVLEAGSGEPLSGAEVVAWLLDNRGNRVQHASVRTDEAGFFTLPKGERGQRGVLLRARHQGRELATRGEHGGGWFGDGSAEGRVERQTVFFTDRAIYRPGQTIQYQGISIEFQQSKDRYEVLPREELTVVFADTNGKEIARQRHRGNDYGSFHGSFTAPRDRLMGQMHLRVENGPAGATHVRVEEYKRPKFQVTLAAPKEAPRLDGAVAVGGKAEAFTGAAVDGAAVKWRVVREVRWPEWWGWGGRQPGWQGEESQEIAHGQARTGADGAFQIEFVAKPDRSIAVTNEPTFLFTVYADVTDGSGETRSAERSVRVGYAALEAVLKAESWQTVEKAVRVEVGMATLDGVPQVAEGVLRLHRLKEPARVERAPLVGGGVEPWMRDGEGGGEEEAGEDRSDPNRWALGEVVEERGFTTDAEGQARFDFRLPAGLYRAVLESQDRLGKRVTARLPLRVVQPENPRLGLKIPQMFDAPAWRAEPGEEFSAWWGTGYDEGRACLEVEHRGRIVQRFWTERGRTQQALKVPVTEGMRGGFTVHVTQVRENRAYLTTGRVEVPWSNKELTLRWERFVSKLQPGQKESWSLVIEQPAGRAGETAVGRAAAELVATLYDASLDQFERHTWPGRFGVFRHDHSWLTAQFENRQLPLQRVRGQWATAREQVDIRYRGFPADLVMNWWGYGFPAGVRTRTLTSGGPLPAPAPMAPGAAAMARDAGMPASERSNGMADAMGVNYGLEATAEGAEGRGGAGGEASAGGVAVDLGQVTARKNLQETAFFYPQVVADTNGEVRLTFTMPEALTTWRFLGFAHDRALRSGLLEAEAVTAKDLMVQPNPPRFLREGDVVEFAVKVTNLSTNRQEGKVRLGLRHAATEESADAELKLVGLKGARAVGGTELAFDVPAKESRTYAWRLEVPDGCGFLAYRAVGGTGTMSDGEEGWLPVLPRRILVTESLPLPIRGKPGGGDVVKHFVLEKLVKSGGSSTLRHQSYTVQMVSQPAWYAVMALPYLMEFPHECSEQVFNRLYANALARQIALRDPKIRRVFELWKGTEALDSPLEKNADLKAVMLEETPWVRQARRESEARRNVGVLFDDNRLAAEQAATLRKLGEMQGDDGLWPWFPGGRGNEYITLYVVTGFGRLRHLGVDVDVGMATRAWERLDRWMGERYREIRKGTKPEDHVPSATECLYLYGRSFFLKERPLEGAALEAVEFFAGQAREHWLKVGQRQSQGHLALALHRLGGAANGSVAQAIVRSLRERAVQSEEMGMYWRETELSWWWYRAPIETQAMMIEVLEEVGKDPGAVEECRVWLLKQKQTQDWKTTKATADAVYALLLRGGDLLASDKLVELTVGGIDVTPGKGAGTGTTRPEAGTGFYERRFGPGEVRPALGEIRVRKVDEGVSWGSVHWQYLEDMTKVTGYEGTPLKLKKAVYRRVNRGKGPELEVVKGAWGVGDELVVRIELRVDRDMEYVHLKDQRGSGTEPVNVLSRYRQQDGLWYYESTRDTASHFFIDYLPKGTYVFEYASRVQQRGRYQTGIASIECMYAPEFNSHSESLELLVQ